MVAAFPLTKLSSGHMRNEQLSLWGCGAEQRNKRSFNIQPPAMDGQEMEDGTYEITWFEG